MSYPNLPRVAEGDPLSATLENQLRDFVDAAHDRIDALETSGLGTDLPLLLQDPVVALPWANETAPTFMRFTAPTRLGVRDGSDAAPNTTDDNPAVWIEKVSSRDKVNGFIAHDAGGLYVKHKALGSGSGASPNDGTWVSILGQSLGAGGNVGTTAAPSWDRKGNLIGVAGFARTNTPDLTCGVWGYASSPAIDAATWPNVTTTFPTIGMEINVEVRHPDPGYRTQAGGPGSSIGLYLYNFQNVGSELRDWTFGINFAGSALDGSFATDNPDNYPGFHVGILLDRIKGSGILFGPYQKTGSYGIRFPDSYFGTFEPAAAIHLGNSKIQMGQYVGATFNDRDLWHNGGRLFFRASGTNERLLTIRGGDILVPGTAYDVQTDAGVELFGFSGVANAVNQLRTFNAATGGAPVVSTEGDDANIDLELRAKGTGRPFLARTGVAGSSAWLVGENRTTGAVGFVSATPSLNVPNGAVLALEAAASAVNSLRATAAATGMRPSLAAEGADADVGLTLVTKGTGKAFLSQEPAASASGLEIASAGWVLDRVASIGGGAFASGTAAAPGAFFSDDTDTGLFRVGENILGITSGGLEVAAFRSTLSAVNAFEVYNSAAGGAVAIATKGADTNVDLEIRTKGTGRPFSVRDGVAGSGAWLVGENRTTGVVSFVNATPDLAVPNGVALELSAAASTVNFLRATGAATTTHPSLSAQGTDANINIALTPKGTGVVTSTTGFAAPRFYSNATGAQTTINYAGGTDSQANSMVWMKNRLLGVVTDTESNQVDISPFKFWVIEDVDSPNEPVTGMLITMDSGGTVTTGSQKPRHALKSYMVVTGQVGDQSGEDDYIPFVSHVPEARCFASQGGPGGWSASAPNLPDFYYRGAIFGSNPIGAISAGSNISSVQGLEANVSVLPGASVGQKIGIRVVTLGNDLVQGDIVDAAMTFSVKGSVPANEAVPFRTGLLFGIPTGFWPFNNESTIIHAVGRGRGTASIGRAAEITAITGKELSLPAYRGIDFEFCTFANAAMVMPGYRLEPNGRVQAHSERLQPGQFTTSGDLGGLDVVLARLTTNATVTRLTENGAAEGAANTLVLPNNSAATYTFVALAQQSAGSAGAAGDWAIWRGSYTMTRGANAAATTCREIVSEISAALGARTAGTGFAPTASAAGAAAWRLTIGADTTNGGSAISGTGEANKTIRWQFRITNVQTFY